MSWYGAESLRPDGQCTLGRIKADMELRNMYGVVSCTYSDRDPIYGGAVVYFQGDFFVDSQATPQQGNLCCLLRGTPRFKCSVIVAKKQRQSDDPETKLAQPTPAQIATGRALTIILIDTLPQEFFNAIGVTKETLHQAANN